MARPKLTEEERDAAFERVQRAIRKTLEDARAGRHGNSEPTR